MVQILSAKSGNNWTTNDLTAFNITVEPRDPISFFGSPLPNTTVDPILLNNLQRPPGAISKDNRLFFRYLADILRFPLGPQGDSVIDDFTAFLLSMLDYDEPERVVHQHLEIGFLMCGEMCYTGTSPDEVEPQLIAGAIAAFYDNNRRRRQIGIPTMPSKVFASIVICGTIPIFYKIPITQELVDAISYAQRPSNQIVVDKLVPPMPCWHNCTAEGMTSLENRRIIIQCLEAFKQVRVLKWSFEGIIWN
ncbi:hypothetical protein AZE42_03912 [Rhizopogon vesiculosus]|uniref:Uncharacterized protein n=1 Tax=Rhizopogon vesiculosus TaxID=180088 RepID=A0A1J8QVJ3_9AGAM|nr:hypothetical protein AZE42_03912 [Rhizopogon vesiculosus]